MPPFFELIHEDKNTGARAGVMHTAHGDIPTPCFMPVGTQASVKTLDSSDMEMLDAPIILANTYHLHLRPGADTIARLGGLHKFMNWNRPILTDSGGFQIFSLGQKQLRHPERARRVEGSPSVTGLDPIAPLQDDVTGGDHGSLVEIDDDGVTFRSHVDGSEHRFTPESAIEIQHKLGADIIMAFDECTPDDVPREYVKQALDRTHKWAERSLEAHHKNKSRVASGKWRVPHLFGIIQGSLYKDLREKSAKFITSLPFDGIAIGGESTGFNMEATKEILGWLTPLLPKDKPRYTMGVGHKPQDLYDAVAGGADMFDCVSPTRIARNGTLFASPSTGSGTNLHITNAEHKEDTQPIDASCACHTCKNYTRAYLHHLFIAKELSAFRLATIHNLHFLLNYMREMRKAILEDKFSVIASVTK